MATTFKIKFHYPPKYNLCRSCKYAYGDVRKGLMCGITGRKPDFYAYCPYFKLSVSRDRVVHKYDDFGARTKFGLLEFWTAMFVLIVLLSPLLDLLGRNSVFFVVITGLAGYSIYTFLTGKQTSQLPVFAYLYALFSRKVLEYKQHTSEDELIVYQTLVRLFGDEIAQKALQVDDPDEFSQAGRLLKRISYYDRRFLFTLLCQLFVFNNLEGCQSSDLMYRLARSFGLSDDEYFRIKQIYLSKEYEYQSRKHQQSDYTYKSVYEDEMYYRILGLSPQASDQEIKARFRRLAKQYHPDKQPDEEAARQAQEQFRIILEAYEQIKKSRGMK